MALHLTITGRVQGVGYRAWAVRQARTLGLKGWVRNRRDGTVEAVVAGEEGAIDRFLEAARRGPPAAGVTAIDTAPSREPVPAAFEQRSTV